MIQQPYNLSYTTKPCYSNMHNVVSCIGGIKNNLMNTTLRTLRYKQLVQMHWLPWHAGHTDVSHGIQTCHMAYRCVTCHGMHFIQTCHMSGYACHDMYVVQTYHMSWHACHADACIMFNSWIRIFSHTWMHVLSLYILSRM